jgi:hypothetical protein
MGWDGNFIGHDTSFYDIHSSEQIRSYLDTKIKNLDKDPDGLQLGMIILTVLSSSFDG